jgi:uncharacterized Tic20 family protein
VLEESGTGASGTEVVAGAGVEGVVVWLVALSVVVVRPFFAAFLDVAFLAGAFCPDAFFVAFFEDFFVVFLARDVFVADFLVVFLAATRRDRTFAPLFLAPLPALFLEPLAALLRAAFAFLLPFFVAMLGSSSFVPLISHTVTKYHCDVHGLHSDRER